MFQKMSLWNKKSFARQQLVIVYRQVDVLQATKSITRQFSVQHHISIFDQFHMSTIHLPADHSPGLCNSGKQATSLQLQSTSSSLSPRLTIKIWPVWIPDEAVLCKLDSGRYRSAGYNLSVLTQPFYFRICMCSNKKGSFTETQSAKHCLVHSENIEATFTFCKVEVRVI